MNFVLRTSLRRVLEVRVGGNEEIEYERKYKEMEKEEKIQSKFFTYLSRIYSLPIYKIDKIDGVYL
jgi:hypothetical protein